MYHKLDKEYDRPFKCYIFNCMKPVDRIINTIYCDDHHRKFINWRRKQEEDILCEQEESVKFLNEL